MKRLVTEVSGGEEIGWLWEPCEHWELAGQSYHHREMARASGQNSTSHWLNSSSQTAHRDAANRERSLNCGARQSKEENGLGETVANQEQPMHASFSIRWNVP